MDIVPVKEHLEQVRRLLKPGGLFLNYGPLRYVRGDMDNMLSGEEILALFEAAGFEIVASATVSNTQFADPVSLTSLTSHNFVFAARKCC